MSEMSEKYLSVSTEYIDFPNF